MPVSSIETQQANDRNFRRGAIMGLTIAESFVLLVFCLLLLFTFWQLQSQNEMRALRETNTDPQLVAKLAEFQNNGTLDALLELQAAGIDIRELSGFAQAEDYWRFISQPELQRLMEGAVKLDDPDLTSLADAVEAPPIIDQLDKLKDEGFVDAFDQFGALPKDKQDLFLDPDTSERLAALQDLHDAGLVREASEFQDAVKVVEVLAADPDLKTLMTLIASLPPETRDALSNLAQDGSIAQLEENIDGLARLADAEATLRGISASLIAAAEAEAQLTAALRSELGNIVQGVDGEILDDGSIVLPENVVFDQGKADIRPSLERFLEDACPVWLDLLRKSGLDIKATEIQGHASREWRQGTSEDQAYRNNLELSQVRARNVLNFCLDQVSNPETAEWSRSHVVAVGYSSSQPIIVDDQIDEQSSRRVVFSIELDRERLLDQLEQESASTIAQSLETGQVVQGTARIIDGDTIEIDGVNVRISGIDAPEMGQSCQDSEGRTFTCGLDAKLQLETIIDTNEVACTHENADRYGRSISTCSVNGIDLGRAMVEAGKAMAFIEFSDRYADAEAIARRRQIGFWNGVFPPPWDQR